MFHRIINPIKSNSFSLFGARGVGKTSFLKEFFAKKKTLWVDLLSPDVELAYSQNPHLVSQPFADSGYDFGKAFEHFVILEAHRLNAYLKRDFRFYYLRTKDQLEVDLIVERPGKPVALIEIKATKNVTERDVATLSRFEKDFPDAELFCLSQDEKPKKLGAVLALPWREGVAKLFEK